VGAVARHVERLGLIHFSLALIGVLGSFGMC
jgi:hypothetical protein